MDWKLILNQSLATVMSATDTATKKAAEGMNYLKNGKGFKGFIAASALVINADNKVEMAELDSAVKNIRAYPVFANYSEAEILQRLNDSLKEARGMMPAMGQRYLIGVVRDNVTQPSAQEVLIEFLLEIAGSDGHVAPEEIAVIKQLVAAFGLPEASFPRLYGGAVPATPVATPAVAPAAAPAKATDTGSAWS